jgi:hypothetical protein
VPLCDAASVSVVNTLLRDGQDTLLGEEELPDRAFGGDMGAVRSVSLESGAVERSNAPLCRSEWVQ